MSHKHVTFSKEEMDKAVELAAKENHERDVHLTRLKDTGPWDKVKKVYLDEAEYLLKNTGENWAPELPQHHYITVTGNT